MPRRELFQNTIYHIYNKGFNAQKLFFHKQDYERFLSKLEKYEAKYKSVKVYCYCILPNHFHFIVKEIGTNFNPGVEISKFFGDLQNSYGKYFNLNYEKSGPAFASRFHAKTVEDENYLYQLVQYVEWNAVKHNIVKSPNNWPYSSYDPTKDQVQAIEADFDPFFQ